jgi:hypothetical protein
MMKLSKTFMTVSTAMILVTGAGVALILVIASPAIWSAIFPPIPAQPEHGELRKFVDEELLSAIQPLARVFDQYQTTVPYPQDAFDDVVRSRLRHRQFSDLETWASKIRATKATIPGGQWQLEAFYSALAEPAVGSNAPDKEWRAHLNLFEEWTNSYPQSITANVSYARAMIGYAWYGRTGRWASNLTPSQLALFKERLAKARALLIAGTDRADKCPEWFHAMQMVALGEGWNRKAYMDVFNAAVRFEPSYGAYYYGLATYLLPRWNGAEGEWQSVLANITESGVMKSSQIISASSR